jgi:hypothetical protein
LRTKDSPAGDASAEKPPLIRTAAGARPRPSREHWLLLALGLGALLGLVVLRLWITPDPRGVGTHEQLGMRPCMTMDLWNLPCPGCGVTTSVTLAAQGHFASSIQNQPFGFAVFGAVLVYAGWALVGFFQGADLWKRWQAWNSRPWLWILGSLCAASWLYKLLLVRGWL